MKINPNKKFHSDPGQGWLAVKEADLDKLGISDNITEFSFKNGKTVYLEEDCDAGTFINACKEHNIKVNVIELEPKTYSPVRYYERFR
jgi:hypothetical protein